MREYFEDQIEKAIPLTEEMIADLKAGREERGVCTKSLDDIQVGDKFLYCMIQSDGPCEDGGHIHLEVTRVLESELDTFAEAHTFVRWATQFPVFERIDE